MAQKRALEDIFWVPYGVLWAPMGVVIVIVITPSGLIWSSAAAAHPILNVALALHSPKVLYVFGTVTGNADEIRHWLCPNLFPWPWQCPLAKGLLRLGAVPNEVVYRSTWM